MLTQLATVKARLSITVTDFDAILTSAIQAVSARFNMETNRNLARTVDFQQEFDSGDTDVSASCYPIESVTKFETKSSETEGWVEQTGVDCLIRKNCIISLSQPINYQQSTINSPIARITYSGGYVLPGTTPDPGQTPLPADIEQAAVEQVACWFQNRDKLGIRTSWPTNGTYQQFFFLDLLPSVAAVLQTHRRYCL